MTFSQFGKQLTGSSGIVDLMEDLGQALNQNPDMLFLGGGNPAHIDAFESCISQHLTAFAQTPEQLHKLVGVYQSPRGNETCIDELASYLKQRLDWPVRSKNIALANGSQSAFFVLINMLAGHFDSSSRGSVKKICFPMMPEYLGYSDQGIADDMFCGYRPKLALMGEHQFKYTIDFDQLTERDDIAAYCVSRPTNPTGNLITDNEMEKLSQLARQQGKPLIVDCAYGLPFPGLVYEKATLPWDDNTIYVLSLSKLGLPGVRTGIVVGNEQLITNFVAANTILSLANGNLGPMLLTELLKAQQLDYLMEKVLLPFYLAKRALMLQQLETQLQGLSYRLHKSEGAFFVWLWLPDLPISSHELYLRLKARGVLIMAGEHFFFGLDSVWQHAQQCIRLNFCQSQEVIVKAIAILADELKNLTEAKKKTAKKLGA